MKAYLLRILVAGDILLMAVMNGKRNETMSAAAWSLERDGKFFGFWRPVIDKVAGWLNDPSHCKKSWEKENQPAASSGFFTSENHV